MKGCIHHPVWAFAQWINGLIHILASIHWIFCELCWYIYLYDLHLNAYFTYVRCILQAILLYSFPNGDVYSATHILPFTHQYFETSHRKTGENYMHRFLLCKTRAECSGEYSFQGRIWKHSCWIRSLQTTLFPRQSMAEWKDLPPGRKATVENCLLVLDQIVFHEHFQFGVRILFVPKACVSCYFFFQASKYVFVLGQFSFWKSRFSSHTNILILAARGRLFFPRRITEVILKVFPRDAWRGLFARVCISNKMSLCYFDDLIFNICWCMYMNKVITTATKRGDS